jgi:CheY-like chemotaxis protein
MLEKVNVLAVDDIEENLVALAALLNQSRVQLIPARSGTEALEALLAHDIALALLDVQMPGMDGFELAELMRGSARTKHVPIIFLTAGTPDRTRLFQGYDAGAVDFL